MALIEGHRKLVETAELVVRIEALESRLGVEEDGSLGSAMDRQDLAEKPRVLMAGRARHETDSTVGAAGGGSGGVSGVGGAPGLPDQFQEAVDQLSQHVATE